MLDTMSMSEYIHWQTYFSVEPFPETRADIRAAEQITWMFIIAGATKLPRLDEIIFDWWGDKPEYKQSPEQIKANMDLIKSMTKKGK